MRRAQGERLREKVLAHARPAGYAIKAFDFVDYLLSSFKYPARLRRELYLDIVEYVSWVLEI